MDNVDTYLSNHSIGKVNYAKIPKINTNLVLELENSIYISGHRDDLIARRMENVRLLSIKKNKISKKLYHTSKESVYDAMFEKNKVKKKLRDLKLVITRILYSESNKIARYLLKMPSEYEPEEYDFKEKGFSDYNTQQQGNQPMGSTMM